jgi:hypothetical protein
MAGPRDIQDTGTSTDGSVFDLRPRHALIAVVGPPAGEGSSPSFSMSSLEFPFYCRKLKLHNVMTRVLAGDSPRLRGFADGELGNLWSRH